MVSNEFLYYAGIITSSVSLGIIIIYAVISYIVSLKLKDKFEDEYGDRMRHEK